MRLRIIFAGTSAFGLPVVEALFKTHHLVALYTQPDQVQGRGLKQQYTPLKTWGLAHHIPVFQPINFKSQESIDTLVMHQSDVMVVVAYGLILPQRVLMTPHYGCINVHASLLPRWRGASPIQQALLHGDLKTGITIMQMDAGLDTGDILTQEVLDISAQDTTSSLQDKLSHFSVHPLLSVLNRLDTKTLHPIRQETSQATYAPKIKKEDASICWSKKAIDIERMIRAYIPWPVAFTGLNGLTIRIFEAIVEPIPSSALPGTIVAIEKTGLCVATQDNRLRITRLQCPGGKILSVEAWIRGHATLLKIGQCFT